MMQKFIENGYEIVAFQDFADIYIINTCTVTNMADRKSRKMLRSVKNKNHESIVVACGCYAQVAKEELEKIPEVDLILGTNEKSEIVSQVEQYEKKNKETTKITDVMKQKEFIDFGSITYTEKTRAVIKIQDGCDRFCSYCIIPYARGRVRSRKMQSIIEEIKELSENGIQEVVITGIHLASYGKDFKEDITLVDVLEEINKINGIRRIRLGSLEPTFLTQEVIERLKKVGKLCNHFHLSLQSGCNDTLKRMNRHYTIEEFRDIVNLIRHNYADVILTTDIIVGFPGETIEEFNKTYEFLTQIKFYKMHVFPYSPRKGTKAANMIEQVSQQDKDNRSKKIMQLSDENEKEQNEKYIGKKVEVLWEEEQEDIIKGHTTNYIEVQASKSKNLKENSISVVKIESIKGNDLVGIEISDKL